MSGLHEALDDIATEITPVDPPIERAMRQGRRKRYARRMAAIAGAAGTMALVAGVVASLPAAGGRPLPAPVLASPASPAGGVPLARPVLLESPAGSTMEYGDPSQVNTATMRLFDRLTCYPTPKASIVNDGWKATVGYTAAQWNAPGREVVSCDASGDKYVLGQAAALASQLTSVAAGQQVNTGRWVVTMTLDHTATVAFGKLTTTQFRVYYPNAATSMNDAVLDSIAIVINGDIQSAPETMAPITHGRLQIAGVPPDGLTKAEARALAAYLEAAASR